jgi:hypothetical protein
MIPILARIGSIGIPPADRKEVTNSILPDGTLALQYHADLADIFLVSQKPAGNNKY